MTKPAQVIADMLARVLTGTPSPGEVVRVSEQFVQKLGEEGLLRNVMPPMPVEKGKQDG